ncbi:MAG: hypothetical protein M1821_009227 [Bathelium mastoideum]|nr:MAG: hypothetical protein M1821_009227 [Bathelium mastoideum]
MAHDSDNVVETKLSRLEDAVRRRGSMTNELIAERRQCTSNVSSQLEMWLLSGALDSEMDDYERLKIEKLLQQLSYGLREDGKLPLVSLAPSLLARYGGPFQKFCPTLEVGVPIGGSRSANLSASMRNAKTFNDRLLDHALAEQDESMDEGMTSDAHCSLEMQEALCELHDALLSSWPNRCNPSHQAMLRLTATPGRKKTKRGGGGDAVEFDVVLSAHSRKWVESKFAVSRSVPARKIRFAEPDEGLSDPASERPVDICHIIETSAIHMKYFRVGITSRRLKSQKYIIGQYGLSSFNPRISLSTLMTPVQSRKLQTLSLESSILSKKYRAVIAVTLAYSFWHLSKDAWSEDGQQEGPWLHRKWAEEGFYFLPMSKHTVDIGRPYLPTVFDDDKETVVTDSMHPSPSIFAFAMTLIHLQCRQMFVDLRANILSDEEKINPGMEIEPSNIDYMAALRLLEEPGFRDEVVGAYRKAISACLKGDFVENFWDLDESEIRAGFFQHVVMLLKRDLKDSWDLTPDDLHIPFEVQLPDELLGGEATGSSDERLSPPLATAKDVKLRSFKNGSFRKREDHSPLSQICLFADECEFRDVDSKDADYADQWFRKIKKRVHPLVSFDPKQEPIKVAIFDTGIQLPESDQEAFEDQIRGCKSWLKGGSSEEFEKGDRDLDGHGTHCASLILKMAQNVSLYVARVFRKRTESSNPTETQETQEAIAKAISHAVNVWKVDIITMSFGCNNRVDNIHEAIVDACNNNVLIFVAASNSGGNDRIMWPARMDRVIRIHATDGNGNGTRFTPNAMANDNNFAVLGSGVNGSWPESLGCSTMRMNGTSCAAPIAAGIAAILLEYVRKVKPLHGEFDGYEKEFDRLRERQGMSSILHKMVKKDTIARGPYNYIEPWELLNSEDKQCTEEYVLRTILRELQRTG